MASGFLLFEQHFHIRDIIGDCYFGVWLCPKD